MNNTLETTDRTITTMAKKPSKLQLTNILRLTILIALACVGLMIYGMLVTNAEINAEIAEIETLSNNIIVESESAESLDQKHDDALQQDLKRAEGIESHVHDLVSSQHSSITHNIATLDQIIGKLHTHEGVILQLTGESEDEEVAL